MFLVFFFGIVAILVGGGAILGFILAVYTFRPRQLGELLEVLKVLGHDEPPPNTAFVGLALAAALPIVGGLSFAASGAKWFVEFFGVAGTYFWAWVAIAFTTGFLLGLLFPGDTQT